MTFNPNANTVYQDLPGDPVTTPSKAEVRSLLTQYEAAIEDGQNIVKVANRATLKALDTAVSTLAFLSETGREGFFTWKTGNYTARLAEDTLQEEFLKADAVSASSGAWVRTATTQGVGFATALWPSAKRRTMVERSRSECHLDDFGADPTGTNLSDQAMQDWLTQATSAHVEAVFGAGKYAISETLGTFEGLRMRGAGIGFWRANPFGGGWTAEAADDPGTSRIILVGTGAKTYQFPNITASRQCGFDRTLSTMKMPRHYMNGYDNEFLLFDGTNANASGVTPATLRSFSAALRIGSLHGVARPSVLKDFMIVPSCPDASETYGTRGYGDGNNLLPFADWDFGLIVQPMSFTKIERVSVVGYYRERGVIMRPGAIDNNAQGQSEHLHWREGYIQGGLAIRDNDLWPIISKGTNYVDVRWTQSHSFSTSGTLKTTNGSLDYTGLSYVAGSPNKLRFTGISDTTAVKLKETVITTGDNVGISHSSFEDMYLADQGFATRIEGPNYPVLGSKATRYRAALEVAGSRTRALSMKLVTPMVSGPLAFHLGDAQNVEFDRVYTEPKKMRLEPGGDDVEPGALFIAGPKASMVDEVGPQLMPSIEMRGVDMTTSVNMAPDWPATDGRAEAAVDCFNTQYGLNWRRVLGLGISAINNSNDLLFTGSYGRAIGLKATEVTPADRNVITRYETGNLRVNDPNSHGGSLYFTPDGASFDEKVTFSNGLVLPEFTATQIASATHAVNTAGKIRGKVIFDGTNGRLMVAAGSATTSSWRVVDNSASVVPS